jgi:Phage P22-like portal protein
MASSDEKLLKEIRDNFDYCVSYWREIREEARKDMLAIAGDPWPPEERRFREANKRLCLSLDELNQYVNQTVNDVRQNKRAVKVNPVGNGATDKTAEYRAGMIRQIEYKSRAQAAYLTGFQSAVERSYGFCKIATEYESPRSTNQVLRVKRIPNPDTIYLDPDAKEADFSDMGFAFELDTYRNAAFGRKWPDAEFKDFSTEMIQSAPAWIKEDSVQVAAYWKVHSKNRQLVVLENGSTIFLDEVPGARVVDGLCWLPDGAKLKVVQQRKSEDRTLCQYITNGIEILETNPQGGTLIPIIAFTGKEIYVDDGSGSKRRWLSLTRLARDPYLLYCYTRTSQAELAGMAPKIPIIGYEGQFDTGTDWENINRIQHPYAEVKAKTTATGDEVLTKPEFVNWEPPIQALEMLAEAARRAIQAAMGKYNTSVGKHDTAAQSGVAVKALDQQADTGSFHLIDNYDVGLEYAGRVMDELLDVVYDSARDVGIRKGNEEYAVLPINQPTTDPETKEPMNFRTDEGDHEVTISTGPSYQSQRDEASQFADALAQNEAIFPRIADLVVKMKDLGPIGDEIADRLTPPDIKAQQNGQGSAIPPAVMAKLQAAEHLIQQLQQEKAADTLAQKTKVIVAKIQAQSAVACALAKAGLDAAAEKLWAEIDVQQKQWDMLMDQRAADTADAAATAQQSDAAGGSGTASSGDAGQQ